MRWVGSKMQLQEIASYKQAKESITTGIIFLKKIMAKGPEKVALGLTRSSLWLPACLPCSTSPRTDVVSRGNGKIRRGKNCSRNIKNRH